MEELRKASYHEDDISKELLVSNVRKSKGLRTAAGAGLTAGVVGTAMVSFPVLAAATAGLGVTGLVSTYLRKIPDDDKRKSYRQGAIRAATAGTLGVAGSIVALPLGLSLAAVATFYPELWKRRKGIAKGAVTAGGGVATGVGAAYKHVIKPGGLWFGKYLTPAVAYFGPRYVAEKVSGLTERIRRK